MKSKILPAILSVGLLFTLAVSVSLTRAQGPNPPLPTSSQSGEKPQAAVSNAPLAALGTAFTYQGQLKKAGNPVNDTCSIAFRLYDDSAAGNLVGNPITTTVTITGGLFTVPLDFGAGVFQGDARWLQIAVKCTGDASYTTLTPRQRLTPAPYALALPGLWTRENITSPDLIGGYSGNSVSAGVVGATIGGGGYSGVINQVTANYGTVGGGSGNTASGTGATVGGGSNNTASGWNSTVAGGGGNAASNTNATVGGGYGNVASGGDATVGGGYQNTASGGEATVAGGYQNTAYGSYATVPGGSQNTAWGIYSFAAGRRAKANHTGAFVWADSTNADFSSTADNQFAVRATGGITFSTGSAGFLVNGNTVWHAGNDGSGSGLDADTLDGQHASAFASAALLGSSSGYEGSQQQLFGMSTTGWAVLTSNVVTHTLVITTTDEIVEYTLWYGSTVVHGEARQGLPATINFPHYQGFQLILARRQYIASLVCNENDYLIACVYQKSHP